MYSEALKETLGHEVVGQPRAVDAVVRGVTRLVSGLTPVERSWCAYLFLGPPGTGRAHLARTLARVLGQGLLTLDCDPSGHADWWGWFVEQLVPLFARQEHRRVAGAAPEPSLVLLRDLECAPKPFFPTLAGFLETGELALPGGRRGVLSNTLVFLTSGLCAAEILDTSRLGFSASSSHQNGGESEDSLLTTCVTEAEKTFGLDLLAQVDDMVIFRRLEPEHLAHVLDRHFARMSRWLAQRGIQCALDPTARTFLLQSGALRPWRGARDLVVAHREQVEFPLADLLLSERLPPGSGVVIDHREREPHLHFTLDASTGAGFTPAQAPVEVPIG